MKTKKISTSIKTVLIYSLSAGLGVYILSVVFS